MAAIPITKRHDVCTQAKLTKLRAMRDGLPRGTYDEIRRRVLREAAR